MGIKCKLGCHKNIARTIISRIIVLANNAFMIKRNVLLNYITNLVDVLIQFQQNRLFQLVLRCFAHDQKSRR
jgi:hypothetical protein